MRPPRLVLIGITTLLASATVSTGADARPRLPGILGAVVGTVGGIVGMRHYAHGGTRYRAAHAAAGPREAAAVETPTEAPQRNPAVAGQIAAAGPLFWPTLSDDVFAYILWPSGNDRIWAYGYGDVVDGALRPANPMARPLARRSPPQTTGSADGGAHACTHPQGTQTADALIERVEQTIQPTDAQRPALDELRAAAQRALAYTDAACPANRVQTPTARLDSMEDRLWAARQALMVMRAPIEKLYGSLDDEQKARFNGPVSGTQRACGQASAQQPTALLDQRIRPTPEQRAGLEAVKMTSAGLAKMVAASCPSEMPLTPLARLDAADKRLNTLLYAVVTLRAPVDGFYASLSDAQKTRLSGLRR
jgi:hypothetical protein